MAVILKNQVSRESKFKARRNFFVGPIATGRPLLPVKLMAPASPGLSIPAKAQSLEMTECFQLGEPGVIAMLLGRSFS